VAHCVQPWDRGKHCSKPYRGDIRNHRCLSRRVALTLYGVLSTRAYALGHHLSPRTRLGWRPLARIARLGKRHKVAHGAQPWESLSNQDSSSPVRASDRDPGAVSLFSCIALVSDPVLLQQGLHFFLIRQAPMVRLLVSNVTSDLFYLGLTDAESCITCLPAEGHS
jgi:hypothetical protein